MPCANLAVRCLTVVLHWLALCPTAHTKAASWRAVVCNSDNRLVQNGDNETSGDINKMDAWAKYRVFVSECIRVCEIANLQKRNVTFEFMSSVLASSLRPPSIDHTAYFRYSRILQWLNFTGCINPKSVWFLCVCVCFFFTGVMDYLNAEISTSKQKKFSLVTFVDTPGLVDGDMIYPFDVNSAITWLGESLRSQASSIIRCAPQMLLRMYIFVQGNRRTWYSSFSTRWVRRCANGRSTLWRSWARSVATGCCFISAKQTKLGRRQTDRQVQFISNS